MAVDHLSLVGGHIALDFMNTVGDHLTGQPSEYLTRYQDLVVWGWRAGAITEAEMSQLQRLAIQQSGEAEKALDRAVGARETIYRLLLAAIRGQVPAAADLVAFNRALAEAPRRTQVIHDGSRHRWILSDDNTALDKVVWRVLWPAADLLTSEQLTQVKVCEGEGCGWVFLDTSRNQARRWCSMSDCGNRAKANRFYQRHKEA